MKRVIILSAAAAIAATGLAIAAGSAGAALVNATQRPDPRTDIGTGERLVVVIAGEYATRGEAIAAEAKMGFHEIVGFLVARSDDFDGLRAGRFLLVTAFRTAEGAAQFQQVARAIGVRGLRRIVTTYRGTTWIGLGQEQHPAGTGPLIGPLPPMHPMRVR